MNGSFLVFSILPRQHFLGKFCGDTGNNVLSCKLQYKFKFDLLLVVSVFFNGEMLINTLKGITFNVLELVEIESSGISVLKAV